MDVTNSRALNEYDPLWLLEDYADALWLVENIIQFGSFSSDKSETASKYLLGTLICIQLDIYEFPESLYRFRQNVAIAKNNECCFEFLAKMIDMEENILEHMIHEQIRNGLVYNKKEHRNVPSSIREPNPDSLVITFWEKFNFFSDEIRTSARDECRRILKEGSLNELKESIYRSMRNEKLSW